MLLAQLAKAAYVFYKERTINLKHWFSSGGMPSSHSALVSSLSIAVGMKEGFTSTFFSICVVFSLVVLYDSAGVRQVVGNLAVFLNRLLAKSETLSDEGPLKIKEYLGHTPLEVIVGAMLGGLIAFVLYP
jgi:acid phosphatase family membrane protein YuiD